MSPDRTLRAATRILAAVALALNAACSDTDAPVPTQEATSANNAVYDSNDSEAAPNTDNSPESPLHPVADARARAKAADTEVDALESSRSDKTDDERKAWIEGFQQTAAAGTSALADRIESSRNEMNAVERASILKEAAQWLITNDADQAQALLGEMKDFRDRRQLATTMIQTLSGDNPAKAADWLSGIGVSDLKPHAHETLAREWARADIDAAIEWIGGITDGKAQVAAGEGLMWTWTQQDLDGALTWAEQLEPSEFRDGVYLKTSKMVANSDPAAATQWAAQFPGNELRSQALTYSLHRWVDKDAAAAATWASSVPDETLRSSALSLITDTWSKRDPEAARQWRDAAGK